MPKVIHEGPLPQGVLVTRAGNFRFVKGEPLEVPDSLRELIGSKEWKGVYHKDKANAQTDVQWSP